MKAHVALLFVGILSFAIDARITDLVPSLHDEKYVKSQTECILNNEPNCDPMVNLLKKILPEAVNGCHGCPATQKKIIDELTDFMKTTYPTEYNKIYQRFVTN